MAACAETQEDRTGLCIFTCVVARRLQRFARMELLFHRGTLLLRGHRLPPQVSELPGVLFDERVAAWRAPAYRYAELRAAIRARGFPFLDRVRRFGVRNQPRTRRNRSGGPPLRPYQSAALLAWEMAGRRGLVVLPTGSGKTHVAIAAAQRLKCRTLYLVPTRVLLEQWLRRLATVSHEPPGCYGDGTYELRPQTVATFESAWRRMDQIGNCFDLLVVDEAHHFGTGIRDEALEMCIAPSRLGLTATPPASPATDRLGELLGPEVFRLGITDLAGTYLAPFDPVTITVELTATERELYESQMLQFRRVHRAFNHQTPEASWADFVRVAWRSDEGRRALRGLHEVHSLLAWPSAKRRVLASLLDRHRDDRVLVFTADNRTAYDVSRQFLVTPITCHISRPEREEALESFRAGRVRCLVSSRVLNEGIDVPAAEIGIVVGAAQGEREHVQRVGRLCRTS